MASPVSVCGIYIVLCETRPQDTFGVGFETPPLRSRRIYPTVRGDWV